MFYLVNDLISMIAQDQIWIADIVNMYNMLTGVIVFILLICKRTVWDRLKKRYPCLERLDGTNR